MKTPGNVVNVVITYDRKMTLTCVIVSTVNWVWVAIIYQILIYCVKSGYKIIQEVKKKLVSLPLEQDFLWKVLHHFLHYHVG